MYIFDGEAYTGDSSHTHFLYSRFRIPAVLFQCHEKHQSLICRHVINCCTCPVSCVCSFPGLCCHFDLAMSFPTPFTPRLMVVQCTSFLFILVDYLSVGSIFRPYSFRWKRMWNNCWNENWQGKPKYLEKTSPSTNLSIKNHSWPDLGENLGLLSGKLATNCQSDGSDLPCLMHFWYKQWFLVLCT